MFSRTPKPQDLRERVGRSGGGKDPARSPFGEHSGEGGIRQLAARKQFRDLEGGVRREDGPGGDLDGDRWCGGAGSGPSGVRPEPELLRAAFGDNPEPGGAATPGRDRCRDPQPPESTHLPGQRIHGPGERFSIDRITGDLEENRGWLGHVRQIPLPRGEIRENRPHRRHFRRKPRGQHLRGEIRRRLVERSRLPPPPGRTGRRPPPEGQKMNQRGPVGRRGWEGFAIQALAEGRMKDPPLPPAVLQVVAQRLDRQRPQIGIPLQVGLRIEDRIRPETGSPPFRDVVAERMPRQIRPLRELRPIVVHLETGVRIGPAPPRCADERAERIPDRPLLPRPFAIPALVEKTGAGERRTETFAPRSPNRPGHRDHEPPLLSTDPAGRWARHTVSSRSGPV